MLTSNGKDATLSPRELARALGVSESSIKRWVDAGRVRAMRTSGGHRRIELTSALKFLRDSGRQPVEPGLLGLDPTAEEMSQDGDELAERVYRLLEAGQDAELARILLMLLVARKIEAAALFDGPVREAMERIGRLWTGGSTGIYEEHLATQTLLRVLDQIDNLFDPEPGAPIAVGASIDGDPSLVPVRMAATVLASAGFQPVDLGADTPPAVLLEAAETVEASLVWISVGYVSDAARQSAALHDLFRGLSTRGVHCIVGGRAAQELDISTGEYVHLGRKMVDMERLARRVRSQGNSTTVLP